MWHTQKGHIHRYPFPKRECQFIFKAYHKTHSEKFDIAELKIFSLVHSAIV